MWKEIEGLKHGANRPPVPHQRFLLEDHRFAVDPHFSGIRMFQAADDAQQGRFAAARGANQDQRAALRQVEGNLIQHQVPIEVFDDLAQMQVHRAADQVSNWWRCSIWRVQREIGSVKTK